MRLLHCSLLSGLLPGRHATGHRRRVCRFDLDPVWRGNHAVDGLGHSLQGLEERLCGLIREAKLLQDPTTVDHPVCSPAKIGRSLRFSLLILHSVTPW